MIDLNVYYLFDEDAMATSDTKAIITCLLIKRPALKRQLFGHPKRSRPGVPRAHREKVKLELSFKTGRLNFRRCHCTFVRCVRIVEKSVSYRNWAIQIDVTVIKNT